MNSNVTLRSNIYVNKTASSDDVEFLQHITDYRIMKKTKDSAYHFGSNQASWMTAVQQEILRQGQPNCAYEKGTMSWGVPVGGRRMRCRCEQNECHLFHECSQYWNFDAVRRFEQPERTPGLAEKIDPLPLYEMQVQEYKPVVEERGDNIQDERLRKAVAAVDITAPDPALMEAIQAKSADQPNPGREELIPKPPEAEGISDGAIQLVPQEAIINADVSERIWVNAGPGTGKTYTVIQRLKVLLDAGLDGTILVLCFSKNAVQVIRERLTEVIGRKADALIGDGQLAIRTFDSFATYMLKDELKADWDYDKRIEAFIKMLAKNRGRLNDMLGYLIVDEIQDTVGIRARMLLAMLDELSCGALLLGDDCQAIFDWTVRDTEGMAFKLLAGELATRKFKKYELEGNRRQSKELASMSWQLRQVFLNSDDAAQEEAVNAFKAWARGKWRSYKINALSQSLSGTSDLVLCKTNGEAAHISQRLFEKAEHVDHAMKQSFGHRTLAPWIAKTLRGNDGQYMKKDDFLANAAEYSIQDADGKWSALKSLDRHPHAAVLHIPEVLNALARSDGLPDICLNRFENCVVVSTVHRAKGSEAERVYWLDSPLIYEKQQGQEGALSDSLKAAYVAATRAKADIHMLEPDPLFMQTVGENRWIQLGFSKGSQRRYCAGIALLPDDTDGGSFAAAGTADEAQELLAGLEPGIPVDLYPKEDIGRFEIYCDGQKIGTTSIEFTSALFAGFEATNHNTNWPNRIPGVYISTVTTVVSPDCPGIDPKYRTAGCWLGLELGGFTKIEWY